MLEHERKDQRKEALKVTRKTRLMARLTGFAAVHVNGRRPSLRRGQLRRDLNGRRVAHRHPRRHGARSHAEGRIHPLVLLLDRSQRHLGDARPQRPTYTSKWVNCISLSGRTYYPTCKSVIASKGSISDSSGNEPRLYARALRELHVIVLILENLK